MTVLIFEDNLMWSARLRQNAAGLGHTAVVLDQLPETIPAGDVAIVNLSTSRLPVDELLARLQKESLFVIGHAGHKEMGLLDMGREKGCHRVVTNSELTNKLAAILEAAAKSQ